MNLRRAVLAVLALYAVNAHASDVYLEQAGDNSNITITQEGDGNIVGTSSTSIYIGGGDNTVTVNQIGSSNTLALTLNGASAGATIDAIGDSNTQTITCGTAVLSSCTGSDIKSIIHGNNNTVTQNIVAKTTSWVDITGNNNNVTHTNTTTDLNQTTMKATITGNLNTVNVDQSGTLAHNAIITSNGSSNTITVTQRQ